MSFNSNQKKHIENNWKLIICNAIICLYIVLGNVSTINLGGIPFKIPELLGLFVLFFLVFCYRGITASNVSLLYLTWLLYGGLLLLLNMYLKNYSTHDTINGLLYCFRMIFIILLMAYFSRVYKKYSDYEYIEKLLLRCYLVVCFLGFIQLLIFPIQKDYVTFLSSLGVFFPNGWDPHIGRLVSTYIDPNYLGSILALPFAITFNNFYNRPSIKSFVELVVIALTVVLTKSRSGFLAIFIVLLYMLLIRRYRGKKIKIQTFVMFMLVGTLLPNVIVKGNIEVINRIINYKTDPSALMRFYNWNNMLKIIKDNWIIGVGYNGTNAYFNINNAMFLTDSSALVAFMCTGLFGVIWWLYIHILMFVYSYRNRLDYLSAFIVSSLVTSNFNNLLFNVLFLIPIMLLIEMSNKSKKIRLFTY